jgi:hypothetical protein
VVAFIFADLIVLPIIAIYVKYYGRAFTIRITALMLLTMAAAALIVDGIFTALGLVPETRPRTPCGANATHVDHQPPVTILIEQGVSPFDDTYCRAVCASCGGRADAARGHPRPWIAG